MTGFLSKNFVQISILILMIASVASLIAHSIIQDYLDVLQKIFSAIGSFSIVVALVTYFHKKKQDELLSTVDQITFFREKIIPEWDKLQREIKKKYPKFVLSRIDLQNPAIVDIKKTFDKNFERQISIFFNPQKNYPDIYLDTDILDGHIFLLNMLEEFSLRVLHLGTVNNKALVSIYNAFIGIVENNAVALMFMRDVKTCNPIYSATLKLYKFWRKKVKDAPFIIKSLEAHGLISKKQRNDFYKMRKEKLGF